MRFYLCLTAASVDVMSNLEGKSAIVAAGAKNLGGLISTTLGARGVNVAVHYNSAATEADADRTIAAIESSGAKAIKVQGDLTVPGHVDKLFDAAVGAFGGVDIAINTVGKVLRKPIVETTEAEYDSMFDINAKAAYFFLQQAGRRLNDGGSVISIVTSLLAAFTDGYSTYAGAKSPVEHFTRAAAKEFAARGSASTTSAPGPWTRRSSTVRKPRAGGVSQVAGHGEPADPHRGHRPAGGVPRRRGPLGDRPDHLRQRRLHHAVAENSAAPEQVVDDAAGTGHHVAVVAVEQLVGDSHSREPSPSVTLGETATCMVSMRPASRNARTVLAPPPMRMSLPCAASRACASTSAGAASTK